MTGILTPADLLGIANQTDPVRGAAEIGYSGSTVASFLNEIANGTATPITSPTGMEIVPASLGSGLRQLTSGSIAQLAINTLRSDVAVPITGTPTVLTLEQYNSGILNFTGELTANSVVQFPDTSGIWIVVNSTTGTYSLTLETVGAGASVALTQGTSTIVYSDGTNIVVVSAAGGGGSSSQVTLTTYNFVATAGQTDIAVTYIPGNIVVSLNGAILPTSDYTATTGTSVTLTTALSAGNEVTILSFAPFSSTGVLFTYEFIATSGQTTFSALYTPGAVEVFENGLILLSTAYTATDGQTVVLTTGATEGAPIKIISQQTASVAAIVPISGGTFTGPIYGPTATAGTDTDEYATTAFVTTAMGSVTAGVTSFDGRTGAVTLEASDITSAGGALLASPEFTGTPTAPTPAAGTDNTDISTTAFVVTALEPYATTSSVTTELESYALLASPEFTGTPTAPTPALGNNSTDLSTTAYVFNATHGTVSVPLTDVSITLAATQYGSTLIEFTGTLTANVPVTFPTTGQWTLNNATTGAFTVTVTNGTGATIVLPEGTLEVVSNSTLGMLPSSSSSPVRWQAPAYSYTVLPLGSVSGAQLLNLSTASEFTMTITGATNIAFTNTLGAGTSEVVYIRFTNAGSAAITWPTGTMFVGGSAPTFSLAGTDLVGVKYDTTSSTYMVFVIGLGLTT